MRYEEVRRLRNREGLWSRLKLWLRPSFPPAKPVIDDLGHLSDHERRDIGLPESVRYADWRALRENGWI